MQGGLYMKIESAALQFSTRPTISRPGDSVLNVLKEQRDEINKRIELVKKSSLSYETKQEKIQLLQDQISNLSEQIAQLQLKEMTEKAKEAAQKNTDDTNKDESPQAINTQVAYGLISADYSVKSGDIGGSVYRKAKVSNQDAAASRALNYAIPEYTSAMKSSKKIEKGLEAYHKQVRNAHRIAENQETSTASQSGTADKVQLQEKGSKAEKA
jgi:hypothetical protein